MEQFIWKEEYSVGVKRFDEDHQRLISYIFQMQQAADEEFRNELVSSILGKLIEYARSHFEAEEKFMDLAAFPEKDVHIAEHKALLVKVIGFCSRANYDDDGVYEELCDLLQNWLVHHILEIDMIYYRYYDKQGLL